MHSGSSTSLLPSPSSSQLSQQALSTVIGIASLILEGRPLSEDDYIAQNFPDDATSNIVQKISAIKKHTTEQDAQRIKLKLLQLNGLPSTSKELECPVATVTTPTSQLDTLITIKSSDEEEFDFEIDDAVDTSFTGYESLQSLATSCYKTIPRSFYRTYNINRIASIVPNSFQPLFTTKSSSPKCHTPATVVTMTSTSALAEKEIPKQGPHCETFLKKIGIIKPSNPNHINNDDMEEAYDHHICNEYHHSICRRWNFNLNQIKSILNHNELLCIDVYLGPEINKILLEQWIIQITEKQNSFGLGVGTSHGIGAGIMMTLQSLCSAIRSQLYFSQICSWTELLKRQSKSSVSLEFLNNPRIKIGCNGFQNQKKSYLDIIYRVKSFKNLAGITASFVDKPNIHNFPDTIISDNYVVKVCLKSSKRYDFIPKVSYDLNTLAAAHQMFGNSVNISTGNSSPSHHAAGSGLIENPTSPIAIATKCTEKGKHQCKSTPPDVDDEDNDMNVIEQIPTMNSNLHREKQLLKYKKRLLKREKKKKCCGNSGNNSSASSSTSNSSFGNNSGNTTINNTTTIIINSDQQHQNTFSTHASINSIRLPLYNCDYQNITRTKSIQTSKIEVSTVSTQTDLIADHFPTCDYCGNDMQCICWNCDNKLLNNISNNSRNSNSSNNNLNNGDLLLQSIYRTTNRNRQIINNNNNNNNNTNCDKNTNNNNYLCNKNHNSNNDSNNNNSNNDEYIERSVTCDNLDVRDCRLCIKRQKIKHNYITPLTLDHPESYNYRRTMSENLTGYGICFDDMNDDDDPIGDDEDQHHKSVLLSPSAISLNDDPSILLALKNYRRAFSEDVIDSIVDDDISENCLCTDTKNVIPIPHRPAEQIHNSKNFKDLSILESRRSTTTNIENELKLPPVHIKTTYPSTSNMTNSTTLSPRFYKQIAITKRRSRHLSDRSSERSSIGSEEQFSDEEYGNGLDNTLTSPNFKFIKYGFMKSTNSNSFGLFKSRPLLGSLEESLLQNRFEPKFQIQGYKVLLGASGGFCPTQLTIPAITNLYELQGNSLSTPYVCEVRLPRKGYSIPIAGTVQTTLLNPQGTVVRMFVVPYDFRDMPNMSTTFIRQRILACDESINKSGKKLEALSNAEQMKLLRYVIHLRFQKTRSGRLSLHTDLKLLISRRTDCDTANAHAKGVLELPNELKTVNISPDNPKYSSRIDKVDKKLTF